MPYRPQRKKVILRRSQHGPVRLDLDCGPDLDGGFRRPVAKVDESCNGKGERQDDS